MEGVVEVVVCWEGVAEEDVDEFSARGSLGDHDALVLPLRDKSPPFIKSAAFLIYIDDYYM
jgi:hypothetical protein